MKKQEPAELLPEERRKFVRVYDGDRVVAELELTGDTWAMVSVENGGACYSRISTEGDYKMDRHEILRVQKLPVAPTA